MTNDAHHESLVSYAKQLVTELESGEDHNAMKTIANLQTQRDHMLFQEVGRLTRSLHESIKNFAIDTGNSRVQEEMSRMEDASQRLNFVIEKTENAAHTTLDRVESIMPVSSQLGKNARSIKAEWDRLMRRELSADQFRSLSKDVDAFLASATEDTQVIESNLSDILMAQDFQDITGQVIKRVIQLVKEVEESLVGMVAMAGAIDRITGISHEELPDLEQKILSGSEAEGPIISPDKREDVVSGQDDVDALLSSLGF